MLLFRGEGASILPLPICVPRCRIMQFGQLVDKYEWTTVADTLFRLYPDQEESREGYESAFGILHGLQNTPSELVIRVETVVEDSEEYVAVNGKMSGDEEIGYSLMGTDWSEWLSMEVDADALAQFGEVEVLAHCLWEMTWVGYTPDEVSDWMAGICDMAEDARERLEAGEKFTEWSEE